MELLTVIGIVALLAAIAIPVFINQQKVAQSAHAKSDLRQLRDAIDIARLKEGKSLREVTGTNCTICVFDDGGAPDPALIPQSNDKWQRYYRTLNRISDASEINVRNLKDAQGRPYIIDENEGESGACGKDYIGNYDTPYAGRVTINRIVITYVSADCISRAGN